MSFVAQKSNSKTVHPGNRITQYANTCNFHNFRGKETEEISRS